MLSRYLQNISLEKHKCIWSVQPPTPDWEPLAFSTFLCWLNHLRSSLDWFTDSERTSCQFRHSYSLAWAGALASVSVSVSWMGYSNKGLFLLTLVASEGQLQPCFLSSSLQDGSVGMCWPLQREKSVTVDTSGCSQSFCCQRKGTGPVHPYSIGQSKTHGEAWSYSLGRSMIPLKEGPIWRDTECIWTYNPLQLLTSTSW